MEFKYFLVYKKKKQLDYVQRLHRTTLYILFSFTDMHLGVCRRVFQCVCSILTSCHLLPFYKGTMAFEYTFLAGSKRFLECIKENICRLFVFLRRPSRAVQKVLDNLSIYKGSICGMWIRRKLCFV